MTLQQLRYILELSRHNSISAAAHALNISQPSRQQDWNFSITPAISCPMPKPCTTISRQKKNRTCLRSCPFHPNTILSPMKPSSMLCSTSRRTRPARSPCAKAGRRKSSMTSSPAKASWASSSYPT